jgi:predicted nucleic-acid-binding protein
MTAILDTGFLLAVKEELVLERATIQDLARAAEILQKYADSKVDFVDCVIVAMAERLNIKRIMTVDQRHFQLFRPNHCSAFEIIPQKQAFSFLNLLE